MTVVAAIAHHGRVVMAADRQTNYVNQAAHGARKVRCGYLNGVPILLGVAGHGGGMGNLLRRLDQLPALPEPGGSFSDDHLDDWADEVGATITGILAELVPPLLEGDGPQGGSADYLLGACGRLWYLFTHQACRAVDGIAALGVGSEVALGAMHTALQHDVAPAEAVDHAVRLACQLIDDCSLGVDGTPHVVDL